jgi:starch phosphorylase
VAELGTQRTVEAVVSLGDLSPSDVQVQALHGPAGQGEELVSPQVVSLEQAGPAEDGHLRYRGTFTCEQAGRYGVTVRVVPNHVDLVAPVELGHIAWG